MNITILKKWLKKNKNELITDRINIETLTKMNSPINYY